jgi:hypothetical protein
LEKHRMRRAQFVGTDTDDAEVARSTIPEEIERLLHSTALRIEQQRIHIQELTGQIHEQVRAKHGLKAMLASYNRLDAYRQQIAKDRQANASKPDTPESALEQKSAMAVRKQSRLTDTHKVGRKDVDAAASEQTSPKSKVKNKSWSPGDKGQGGEGNSKGYGGSGGPGTGPSGPEEK